jgi:hypothetical protein
MGTVVAPDGVVVYGTGYSYQPWISFAWPAARHLRVAAQRVQPGGGRLQLAMGGPRRPWGSSRPTITRATLAIRAAPPRATNIRRTAPPYTQGTRSYYANSTASDVGERRLHELPPGTGGSYTAAELRSGYGNTAKLRVGSRPPEYTTGNVARQTCNASPAATPIAQCLATGKGGSSVARQSPRARIPMEDRRNGTTRPMRRPA